MKKRTFLKTMAGLLAGGANLLQAQAITTRKKGLVVYFSRKGNNYVDGEIVFLEVGNTEVIAKKIQRLTGSGLFEIETVKIYPDGYEETTRVAKQEQNEKARPALKRTISDIGSYDVVYLGYPNWWGTMPMALFTFLESHDLSGKTIVPFCTHEGSRLGSSERDIKALCPKSNVLPGLAIKGSNVHKPGTDSDLATWLKRI